MRMTVACRVAVLIALIGAPHAAPRAAAAGEGVIPPPDESHANRAIGSCGARHFDPRMEFCDARNLHLYRFTNIGDQTWMAENLDYGTMIAGRDDQTSPGQKYCLFDDADDCAALYQWASVVGLPSSFNTRPASAHLPDRTRVQGICPQGWRVPTLADWDRLVARVGKDWGTQNEAVSLMAYAPDDHFRWKTNTDPDSMLPIHDRYGMSIIATGQRVLRGTCPDGPASDSSFCSAHDMAKFWTADDDPADPTKGGSITIIEDLPRVANSARPVFDTLPPDQKSQWLALMKAKARTQSVLQRSYQDSVKQQGMALRCIRNG